MPGLPHRSARECVFSIVTPAAFSNDPSFIASGMRLDYVPPASRVTQELTVSLAFLRVNHDT